MMEQSQSPETTGQASRCLLCRVDSVVYGIPAELVHESMPAAPGIQGEVPFQGKLFPIVDLRLTFALPPADPKREGAAVLIEAEGQRLALLVDSLGSTEGIPEETREELPWTYRGFEKQLFSRLCVMPGGEVAVVFRHQGLSTLAKSTRPEQQPDSSRLGSHAL